MTPETLREYLEAGREAARRGAALLEEWRPRFQVHEKAPADLVTEADLASQQVIRDFLLGQFPGHAFLGEEGGPSENRPGPAAPPTWVVDPLDGTTNYVHGYPAYCVSIGLQVDGTMVVGVIFDPRLQEMFSAASGQGAWLNDQRLQPSRTERLEQALLSTGFPANVLGHEYTLDWWRYFALRTQSLRRTGSTALNLAYVAAGRFDGYWAFNNHPWDVAAGMVLIEEAGARITNIDGSPFDPYTPDALASNGPLHPALLDCLRQGP